MVGQPLLKKIHSPFFIRKVAHAAMASNGEPKRFWHYGKLGKALIALTITAIILVSLFAFLMNAQNQQSIIVQPQSNDVTSSPTCSPTVNPSSPMQGSPTPGTTPPSGSNPPSVQPSTAPGSGLIGSDPNMGSSTWRSIAKNAWNYFEVGRGVDATTGLPASKIGWNYFTDWDLGVYIQAIMDAQKVGLIGTDGTWGSHDRLNKVITFLETRPLEDGGVPFWFYSVDGSGSQRHSEIDAADTGTLLAALNNAKSFDNSFASRIDNFVYNRASSSAAHNSNGRTNYESLVDGLKAESTTSNSIYSYYAISGFSYFFPALNGAPDDVLNRIKNADPVTTFDVALPKAKISCEPLLYSVFNLRFNSNYNSYLNTLMKQVYSAHEAEYTATGKYIAFSEGVGPSPNDFVWEWVVQPNGDVWKVSGGDGSFININPVIYTKVSLSFLALYNSQFAYKMSVYLEKLSGDPANGYIAGADYNQNINAARVYGSVDSNTNGLILSAARYALGS
jgi:hypothetical protein